MTKKSLGFTELEWICPNCKNRNPGTRKSCASCGVAQPDDIDFIQPVHEAFIEDDEKIAAAKAGPDIHCGYCGTRNPAGATICKQCGGYLSEGQARIKGNVLGAHRHEPAPPISCPSCGSENLASAIICANCGSALPHVQSEAEQTKKKYTPAPKRSRWLLFLFVGAVLLCIVLYLLTSRTTETVGEVSDYKWSRSIAIMALIPVEKETWENSLPDDAAVGQCRQKMHHTQETPAEGAREVCGTPYTVDTGTGLGEVVQDCKYEIYRSWCEYSDEELRVVNTLVSEGRDQNPSWPALTLENGQQEGEREETYTILFTSDDETYRMSVSRPEDLQKYPPGSRWQLDVNTFGGVRDAEPLP